MSDAFLPPFRVEDKSTEFPVKYICIPTDAPPPSPKRMRITYENRAGVNESATWISLGPFFFLPQRRYVNFER